VKKSKPPGTPSRLRRSRVVEGAASAAVVIALASTAVVVSGFAHTTTHRRIPATWLARTIAFSWATSTHRSCTFGKARHIEKEM
jgi:hypothetical protein